VSHEPIDQQTFPYGVNVVDIGDVRVSRGFTRRGREACKHKALSYDNVERRIWCRDCERDVEGFDAFAILAEAFDNAAKNLESRERAIKEAEERTLRRRATKVLDEAWSSRHLTPVCPHCGDALLPEDVVSGVGLVNVEMIRRRRAKGPRK
jgi:hypothetical protein